MRIRRSPSKASGTSSTTPRLARSGNFNPSLACLPHRQDDRQNIVGTFVQDDFKVSPTLTINAGLRWNYFGTITDKQNNLSIVTPGVGAAFLTGLTMVQGGDLYDHSERQFRPPTGLCVEPDYFQRKSGHPRRLWHQLRTRTNSRLQHKATRIRLRFLVSAKAATRARFPQFSTASLVMCIRR